MFKTVILRIVLIATTIATTLAAGFDKEKKDQGEGPKMEVAVQAVRA